MRWTSLVAVVRMLMLPWSGKGAEVTLDEESSPLPHQESLCNSLLRNESDETIALDEAHYLANFCSQRQPVIDHEPLSTEEFVDEALGEIVALDIPADRSAEPLKKSDYKFYVDGLIELPNVEGKALSQRGGVLSPASPTTVSDDTVTTLQTHPHIDRPEKSY